MRIDEIEFDEKNVEHVTRHGVSIEEIEGAFTTGTQIRRNPSGRTGDYYIVANGIRVTSCTGREWLDPQVSGG
jgi:uncharacterized DUF497 family protein